MLNECDVCLKIAFPNMQAKFLLTSDSCSGKHDNGETVAVHSSVSVITNFRVVSLL